MNLTPPAVGATSLGPPDAKRTVDLGLLALTLPVWLPLLVLTFAVALLQGARPLHAQWRVGRNGRMFLLWKIRTMVPDAELRLTGLLASDPALARQWDRHAKLDRDPRTTRLGRVLRRYRLDELPQVWNVLRGDMSLVGPRPVPLTEFQCRYAGTDAADYLALRPGLSGMWQVSGTPGADYAERLALDRHYAARRGPGTDLWILWRTIGVVLAGRGQ